ncbi:MAG TPA: bacillithiol biosynthesis deacetylase BshB1 [Blastocatellia bacterium]|nr:bacillithiol biosynthesis deacetylase BshB1 [Blastocatellia bacterium]
MTEDVRLDVLAVGAHPDDAELGIGGTLVKLVSLGYRVGVLDMSRGELGTRGTAEIRAAEAAQAASEIGLAVRDNLDQPDGHIWLTEESRTLMVRKVRKYRPRVIMTHYWEDPHPDHVHTCQIVREAAHIAGLAKYDAGAHQERFRPHTVAHFMLPRTAVPTFVVDITGFAEKKMAVINCYRSQLHDPKSKELETNLSSEAFLRRIESRSRYYGSLIGVEHGEALVVREALNVPDPVALLSRPMAMYS